MGALILLAKKMNCYIHRDLSSVGICKSCGRGLCPECATEVGEGLSCPGRCEPRVQILNTMIERNAQIITTTNRSFKSAAFFSITMGAAFFIFGAYLYSSHSGFSAYFLMVLGALYAIYGFLRLRRGNHYPVDATDDKTKNG